MASSDNAPLAELQPAELLALVEQCREGDKEALGTFYRRYRAEVARALYRVLGPARPDLEDALQDVFIEVFRSIARFRGDCKVSTWLYRVTVNVAFQRLRKVRRRAEVQPHEGFELSSDQTPLRAAESRERIAQVYRLLDALSPKKRLVFILHEIEGREPKEIAELVRAPVLTVRTRLHYARKQFFALAANEPALGPHAHTHDARRGSV